MTKEEIIETINKMMERGMQNYLLAKNGNSDRGLEYWDGYTEAIEDLSREIAGEPRQSVRVNCPPWSDIEAENGDR